MVTNCDNWSPKPRTEQDGTPVPDEADWVVQRLKIIRKSYDAYSKALEEGRVQWTPGGLERLVRLVEDLMRYRVVESTVPEELKDFLMGLVDAFPEMHKERGLEYIRKYLEQSN